MANNIADDQLVLDQKADLENQHFVWEYYLERLFDLNITACHFAFADIEKAFDNVNLKCYSIDASFSNYTNIKMHW